jgi:ActD protein
MKPGPGLLAEFTTPEGFAAAVARVRAAGYTRLEAYMPFAVEGVAEAIAGGRRSPMAKAMLIGGLVCGLGAYGMEFFATHIYPLNVGGRPLHSWPAFVPITFELTVLGAALTGVFAFFWQAGFPRLDHAVFADRRFDRASQDRFFLCIRGDDPLHAGADARGLLLAAGAESVEEVAL